MHAKLSVKSESGSSYAEVRKPAASGWLRSGKVHGKVQMLS